VHDLPFTERSSDVTVELTSIENLRPIIHNSVARMPTLKQLRCEIEWGSTQTPFPEYGTTYGDGVVETYIAVPDHSQPFAIHLRSNKYIAEGLAMLIFMDGDYQCNRNRLNLVHPEPGSPENVTKISLRVRQKEKALGDGTYIGRAWRFDRHNIGGSFQAFGHSTRTDASEFSVPLDRLPSDVDRQHFDELGTICVFVLRCRAKEDAGHRSATSSDVDDSVLRTSNQTNEMPSGGNTPSNTANTQPVGTEPDAFLGFMNDGAADAHHFGLDGEGPGPAEQKAWSWHTPHPSMAAGPGILSGYAPGQPQLAQTRPYGSYGHPSGFSQPLQSGPASNQDQQASHHPQRRVHFNDQLPQQSSGYGAAGPPYSEQDFSANPGHSQEREYPQQPGNYARPPQSSFPLPQPGSYGYPPQSEYTHQVPSRAPVPDGFANPSLANGGIPTAQDHSRGFPIGADWGYPPSMTSYQPIGYGVPGYSGWPSAAYHPAYAQPPWQGQSMPGPSYVTLPNFAASFQPSHPYPYPQSAYSGGPVAPIPPTASGHPGGGIWGPPPPGSQDPAKEENNQLDGQGNQNQDSTCNAGDPSNNNNDQALPKDDDNKIEAGDSGWNNTDTSGGQMDNWNNTNTQTEAPTNDWNRSTINTGQINNAEPSWNTIADTSTQVQDSWNTAPAAAQPNETPFTIPQQSQATATVTQGRPLYGPHGPYYGTVHGSTDRGLQADAGEEPPYDVPEDMPTTHQVKPGEGYVYVHKRRSPEYLDTLEEPYARFVFKYRTKGESSRILELPPCLVPRPRSRIHPACFSSRRTRSYLRNCGTPTEDGY